MKSKIVPFLFLLVLAVAVLFLKKWQGVKEKADPATVTRGRGFDRRISTLDYTAHALCRMDCRKISKNDVQDIMRTGEINYAKSDLQDKPCPSYALQGYSNDGQHLRVVFGQCKTKTNVITCIDLEKDFECSCPGDEKKNKKQ